MKAAVEDVLNLSGHKIRSIIGDPEKTAKVINLRYVRDTDKGFRRTRSGKGFSYYDADSRLVKDKSFLARIKSLGIPPAWENVWICQWDNGHLQATGFDSKNRKQYIYHAHWNALRNQTKFYRLLQFGRAMPGIRTQVEKDLKLPGMPVEKVLALVVSLMEQTNMRIGNTAYEKLYGSFGLTTLKNKHVKIDTGVIKFSFKGKKGVYHDISIKNKRLARIIKACMDIPGKELFQYYTPEGEKRSIDSGMVNDYIRQICGEEFTSKDFRTWSGTLLAFSAFKEVGGFEKETEAKKKIVEVLDIVAKQLGNTRSVCKKYYVHPVLLSLYETHALEKFFNGKEEEKVDDAALKLSQEEKMVLRILENN